MVSNKDINTVAFRWVHQFRVTLAVECNRIISDGNTKKDTENAEIN